MRHNKNESESTSYDQASSDKEKITSILIKDKNYYINDLNFVNTLRFMGHLARKFRKFKAQQVEMIDEGEYDILLMNRLKEDRMRDIEHTMIAIEQIEEALEQAHSHNDSSEAF